MHFSSFELVDGPSLAYSPAYSLLSLGEPETESEPESELSSVVLSAASPYGDYPIWASDGHSGAFGSDGIGSFEQADTHFLNI